MASIDIDACLYSFPITTNSDAAIEMMGVRYVFWGKERIIGIMDADKGGGKETPQAVCRFGHETPAEWPCPQSEIGG